jgi:hypothetical protein
MKILFFALLVLFRYGFWVDFFVNLLLIVRVEVISQIWGICMQLFKKNRSAISCHMIKRLFITNAKTDVNYYCRTGNWKTPLIFLGEH